jgi:hypothetical protein
LHAVADKPRVKAPRVRSIPASRDTGRRRLALGAVGGAGLLAIVAIALFVLLGSGAAGEAAVREDLEAAGCTLVVKPARGGAAHSVGDPGGMSKKWNTDPPTNGPHYAEPAIFGSYNEPLEPARLVHNLEHGGVFIQYGKDVPAATVEELQSFYDDHKAGTLLSPLPRLGDQIALGAWVWTDDDLAQGTDGRGVLAKCNAFDDSAYSAFFDEYQFRGSHGNDPNLLQPGQ